MKSKSKYLKDLDILRVIACIAVFLYHLGILKGGYLAVCTFFLLSGYLNCLSLAKEKKVSLKNYYLNRLKKIYLPLLIVVFITIGVSSFFHNIDWLNLKNETLSVVFGYNNYWQLNASMDYFSRHIDSPFIHLWYIAILIQIDLIFPFLYMIIKKIGDKTKKIISCIIPLILGIISFVFFVIINKSNMMISYYSTITRSFPLFFGLSLGFWQINYGNKFFKKLKNKKKNYVMQSIYLILLILVFIFCDTRYYLLTSGMALSTLLSTFIIIWASVNVSKKLNGMEKGIKAFSKFSYEIYLVQYPVIYFMQLVNLNNYLKILIIVIVTLVISYLIHYVLDIKEHKSIISKGLLVIVIIFSFYGLYYFIKTPNYRNEMKKFEAELEEKAKELEKRQEEYLENLEKLNAEWQLELQAFKEDESKLNEVINNLPIVGIGDSVMLGAVDNLEKTFKKGYFDAKVSRSPWVLNDILQELKSKKILNETVLIHLGTNGDCSKDCKEKIMTTLKDNEVYWINTTNNDNFNNNIKEFAKNYSNLHIIDWKKTSAGHENYFGKDKIHLTHDGKVAYTKMIYDVLYDSYLKKLQQEKDNKIKEFEATFQNKYTFYGSSLLLNSFTYLKDDFKEANFIINKDYNINTLKLDIENSLKENKITKKIVFILDKNMNISDYDTLISLLKDYECIILVTTNNLKESLEEKNYSNVKILDFYTILKEHPEYYLVDKININDSGSKALNEFLKSNLQ